MYFLSQTAQKGTEKALSQFDSSKTELKEEDKPTPKIKEIFLASLKADESMDERNSEVKMASNIASTSFWSEVGKLDQKCYDKFALIDGGLCF